MGGDTGQVDLHVGISVDGDGNLQRVDKSFLEMVEPLGIHMPLYARAYS